MNLRKDAVTDVIFDADDPAQLAAHPNHKPTSVGKGDTTIRDGYAIKNPSPIAGRVVRPDLDSPKRGQK
jgi:hypothetical protein